MNSVNSFDICVCVQNVFKANSGCINHKNIKIFKVLSSQPNLQINLDLSISIQNTRQFPSTNGSGLDTYRLIFSVSAAFEGIKVS